MIIDKIEYAENYYGISNNLRKGFEWLKNQDLNNLLDGRYELMDGNYANVQTYETKTDALYEAHRNYIDIQYMINGIENVGVTDYKNCKTSIPYDTSKDIEFLINNKDATLHKLETGTFIVLFPNDAHKPSIDFEHKNVVKKVVVKVKI